MGTRERAPEHPLVHADGQVLLDLARQLEPLRNSKEYEKALEIIVAKSKCFPPEQAPLFNKYYNDHYRLAAQHLPSARLKRLNERINKGEFTIRSGYDAALNSELRDQVPLIY